MISISISTMMIHSFVIISCIIGVLSIPASMVEEIKTKELNSNEVKRVTLPARTSEENFNNGDHYSENPTAIKRGAELKSQENSEDVVSNNNRDWNSDEQNISNDFPSSLYNYDASRLRKDLNGYDKSFQYGNFKNNLDETLENAAKSELYNGGPSATLNRYGYIDEEVDKKRRKRNSRKFNYNNELSSNNDLTPSEVLELLALYESERYQNPEENPLNYFDKDNDDETWLDVPIRPHTGAFRPLDVGPAYQNEMSSKYLMAARKRNDPTKQIRYLTGPTKHDYYTLTQLLSNQREADVPVYHRYVL